MTINFTSSFITECISKGKVSIEQMCNEALDQIKVCDEELNKADLVRSKKEQLLTILKNFNYKQDIIQNEVVYNSPAEVEELKVKICNYISEHDDVKAGNLIEIFGGYTEQAKIYYAIKSLGELEVIKRDDQGFIIEGPNWECR